MESGQTVPVYSPPQWQTSDHKRIVSLMTLMLPIIQNVGIKISQITSVKPKNGL